MKRERKKMKTFFVTGSAGFIGSNLAKRILTDEKGSKSEIMLTGEKRRTKTV